jgi:Na+/H+-dicarboxylate symporter
MGIVVLAMILTGRNSHKRSSTYNGRDRILDMSRTAVNVAGDSLPQSYGRWVRVKPLKEKLKKKSKIETKPEVKSR